MRSFATGIAFLVLQSFCLASARADQKADTLLAEVKAAYKGAKTMTATMTVVSHFPTNQRIDYTLTLQKPDKYRRASKIITGASGDRTGYIAVSNGKSDWSYDQAANQYTKRPSDPGTLSGGVLLIPAMLFFKPGVLVPDPKDLALVHAAVTSRLNGTKKLGALTCQVLVITTSTHSGSNTMELWIGPDKLVRRAVMRIKFQDQAAYDGEETIVTNMKVNVPVSAADFTFVPPAGAKEEKEPKEAKDLKK